jgi:dye decolorizing peroxidase
MRLSRRQVLTGGLAAGAGLAAGGTTGALAGAAAARLAAAGPRNDLGGATVPFHGPHQAGVETPPQAHATFVAFDLDAGVGRAGLRRLMRLWTSDAERLTQGLPALADTEPALAERPARLTVTLGLGAGALVAAHRSDQAPAWLGPLPAFGIDRLEPRWTGGDLLLQFCGDDAVAVSHAVRTMARNARSYTSVRWVQQGFREAAGTLSPGATGRNLMGQLDGTINPRSAAEFDALVWTPEDAPGWLLGGTSVVVRRIRMDLDAWDLVSFRDKEQAMGRRLADGAPLTGGDESTDIAPEAVGSSGLEVIPRWAHVRRARGERPGPHVLRRSYNYDAGIGAEGVADAGLVFVAFQADPTAQFVPVQRRLDELDLLNRWTTPIGSAVFAVLPGVDGEGHWFAEALLD